MAIVFENVTAEIAPPATAGEAAPAQQQTQQGPDPLEALRHALALMAERQARLLAD
ncbi:hypothetical protein [Variovorax rhizosphaerae]|uniref:Uncharacterized protein n=1 Tax=Variovorax rhizosphaerae TaxID=1836200 RepID=A0ABU8WVP5_9BURK